MTSVIDPNAVPAEENTVDIDSAKLDAARSKWAVEAGLSSATDPAGAGVALLEPEAEQEPPTTLERDEAARRTEQRAGLLVQKVSGRYRSPIAGFQLELRVDVDGNTPLGKLSGDYYTISGGVTSYFGSWIAQRWTGSGALHRGRLPGGRYPNPRDRPRQHHRDTGEPCLEQCKPAPRDGDTFFTVP